MIVTEYGEYLGVCEDCGYEGAVSVEADRCEDCEGQYYPCSICQTEQHEDSACRHIFRAASYEWCGSGAWIDPKLRKPLFLLFDLMPGGFAVDLRSAILSGRFYTFASLPLIGDGGSLELNGMPERDGMWVCMWWGNFLMEIGRDDDHAHDTADAYHLLASLYQRKTLKANRTIILWIDEYLKRFKPVQPEPEKESL